MLKDGPNIAKKQKTTESTSEDLTPLVPTQTETELLRIQQRRLIRLHQILLIPNVFQSVVNSGDFEMLSNILNIACVEDCSSNPLTMNSIVHGREAILEYQKVIFNTVPDFILKLNTKTFRNGIISCYYSTRGTGLCVHNPSLLWHCVTYGMKENLSEEVIKQKVKFDAYINRRIFFEFKGKVNITLLLNETMTEIVKFMYTPTSIEFFDSLLPLLV